MHRHIWQSASWRIQWVAHDVRLHRVALWKHKGSIHYEEICSV